MKKSLINPAEKAGLAPGSLIHVGDVHQAAVSMSALSYTQDSCQEIKIESLTQLIQLDISSGTTWLIVEGLHDVEVIEKIGDLFNIHRLVLEDVLNTHQRPKFEEYEDCLYIVVKSLQPFTNQLTIEYEQLSILIFENLVITFKEKTDSLLQPIQQRILNSRGMIRRQPADYLAYSIIDTIVDLNFSLIDRLDERISSLESEIFVSPTVDTLAAIQKLKREIITIRRNTSPIRELLTGLMHNESKLLHSETHLYFRDVFDHVLRVIESLDSFREILSGLLEIYISTVNNKMNEVMKVLTIFATIFIPLTFLTGIYGMNFEFMPELKWQWAYPTMWAAFVAIPTVLLIYFKKNKWF